jgi:hypothetical protein
MNFLAVENLNAMHRILPNTMRSTTQATTARLCMAQRNFITQKIMYCLPYELTTCKQVNEQKQEFHKYLVIDNDPATWLVKVSRSWLFFGTNKGTPILYAPAYAEHNVKNKLVDSYVQVTNVATTFQGLQIDDESIENSNQCLKQLSDLTANNNDLLPTINTVKIKTNAFEKSYTLPAQYLSDEHIASFNNAGEKNSWEQREIITLSAYNELCTRSTVY